LVKSLYVIVFDPISLPSWYKETMSCQFILKGNPTNVQVTKKLALRPYLSKTGLAAVNWPFQQSPKVRMAILLLFGVYWAITFLETADENTPAIITEDNIRTQNNLIGASILAALVSFRLFLIFGLFLSYSFW